MHIQYGSYAHDPGEIQLSVSREAVFNDAEVPYAVRERWDMDGMLVGDSQSDIDRKVRDLTAAYSQDGLDLSLKLSAGGDTHLRLKSTECIGGTRVTQPPSFPSNSDAAYVTFLPYAVSVEGLVALAGTSSYLVSFQETIARSGGGPRYGMIEPLTGMPIRQLLKRNTIYRATQRGSATGLYTYPSVPLPLWPAALKEAPKVERVGPRVRGTGATSTYTHYTVSWSYEFESATPLIGNPHSWGTT